jgi:predicted  nucleic acid-binding Zn-ribbon protein
MAEGIKMICFPVLDTVSVSNFALYRGAPGAPVPGLHHTFKPGVNVIVGINGLGKTTLLNILLRAFTGPFDTPQGEELGEKRRRTVPADRQWFRRRVPDDAVNATVTVTFSIGKQNFELKRSLANLDLIGVSIDQQPLPKAAAIQMEAMYHAAVIEASGLSSFEDFVFLLRYVVFFLEDRRSLMWDPSAQGDILGMLFGSETSDRQRYVEVFNDLLSKDSEYRNMHAVVSKRKKVAAKQAAGLEGGQLEMLIKQIERTNEERRDLLDKKANAAAQRDSLRAQIENRKQDIHDKRSDLASRLNTFYESFFPSVNDTGRYLLAHFEAETGCLVCGSRDAKAMARVGAKLDMNVCPVCESPIEHPSSAGHNPHASQEIEDTRHQISSWEKQLADMQAPLRDAEQTVGRASAQLVAATSTLVDLEAQLRAFGDTVPEALKRREDMQQSLASFESALNLIETERAELAQEFNRLAAAIDEDVRGKATQIEQSFKKFISGFLAETCEISYTTRVSRLGQRAIDEMFPFPQFIPALTSGVHRESVVQRLQGQSVSESQKEFIDLAFRMALLEVAAPEAPSMLVLETPEASLDSVFVPRAADLLRRFAIRPGGGVATRLIASSNVNREQMIPALFGAYPDKRFQDQVVDVSSDPAPPKLPEEDRAAHVLDLLQIAEPTRALERFRAPYEDERNRAIYPERYAVAL